MGMSVLFSRVMEFSVYGIFWITILFLVSLWIGKRTGILWQYFVAVCIAVHLLVPVHVQWFSLDISLLQERYGFSEKVEKWSGSVPDNGSGNPAIKKTENSVQGSESYNIDISEPEKVQRRQKQELLQEDSFVYEMNPEKDEIFVTAGKSNKKSLAESLIKCIQDKKHFCMELLAGIWCFGMLCYFGRILLSYVAFRKMVKRWSLPAKPIAHQILEQVKLQYGIRRNIELKRNGKVTSPVLYGLVKPAILLPDMSYSEAEYRYIFQHELSHYKHGDIFMKYVFTFCQGVYWFHPMVHWMCRRAFWQMEFLCDESVVRGKEMEEKREYSMVLLKHMLSGISCKTIPLTTSFYGGKDCMKMRFQNIMNSTKKKAGIGALLLAVVVVIALGGVKWSTAKENASPAVGKEVQEEVVQNEVKDRKILVVGTDSSSAATGFADALLLVDINGTNGRITVENVPRELRVNFKEVAKTLDGENIKNSDSLGEGKLSDAYIFGCDLLIGSVEYLYQVEIDSYLVVNYEAVSRVIDAAGGVEVTLTKKEANYLNRTNYISKKKNRTVKAGKQILNGNQAVGYMRVRKNEAGSPVVNGRNTTKKDSFARISRCSNVLYALADQVKQSEVDWAELIYSLVEGKAKAEIEVNISVEELVALAEKLVSGEFTVEESEEADKRVYVEKIGDIGQYLIMDSKY